MGLVIFEPAKVGIAGKQNNCTRKNFIIPGLIVTLGRKARTTDNAYGRFAGR